MINNTLIHAGLAISWELCSCTVRSYSTKLWVRLSDVVQGWTLFLSWSCIWAVHSWSTLSWSRNNRHTSSIYAFSAWSAKNQRTLVNWEWLSNINWLWNLWSLISTFAISNSEVTTGALSTGLAVKCEAFPWSVLGKGTKLGVIDIDECICTLLEVRVRAGSNASPWLCEDVIRLTFSRLRSSGRILPIQYSRRFNSTCCHGNSQRQRKDCLHSQNTLLSK